MTTLLLFEALYELSDYSYETEVMLEMMRYHLAYGNGGDINRVRYFLYGF